MTDLPKVRQEYEADTRGYSGPLREAGRQADQFSDKNSRAALAARKMGLAAKEAADKAARSMSLAGEAAEKLAEGEIKAEEAAQAEARALKDMERAAIAAAEAEHAVARAANEAAQQERQAARDAELAGAAQRLAALKAAGAVHEHNAVLKDLEGRFGNLSREGSGAFKAIETDFQAASMKLSGKGPLIAIGIANALAMLPAIAAVAADGITLALGGALAAVGLMAQAKSADVRRAWSDTAKDISGDLKKISAPFHDTLLHVSADADHAFHRLEPALQDAFAAMAPAVTRFSNKLSSAISSPHVQAAIRSIGAGFSKVLDSLGSTADQDLGNIADGIKSIADAAASNPQALASLVTDISELVKYAGEGIGALVRYKDEFELLFHTFAGPGPGALLKAVDGFQKLKDTLTFSGGSGLFGQITSSATGVVGPVQHAGQAMSATGSKTVELMTAQKAASMSSDQLKAALDRLTGANQNQFDASIQYRQALVAANDQAKKSNAGIDGNSKAAIANSQALSQLATATKNNIQYGHLNAQQIEQQRQAFIHAAEGMGVSKQRAKELADQLIGVSDNVKKIPDKKNVKLGATDNTQQGVSSAKKSTGSWASKPYKAQLTAANKAQGAVSSAIGLAKKYSNGLYKAQLTAANKAGGVISSTASAAKRYATASYRAQLTAVNHAGAALRDAIAAGLSWQGRVFTATFNVVKHLFAEGGMVEGYADGGAVQHFPSGGPISGPGTETSDSIPIMVSNGEYVINAKQARKHRQLLDAINFGLDGYATGGTIKGDKGAAYRAGLAKARPEYLAALAAQESLTRMRNTIYGGLFHGGASTLGSAHGSVIQHVTTVQVTVMGSVTSEQDLTRAIQRNLIVNRMPTALGPGR